jgi:hypothetical protein
MSREALANHIIASIQSDLAILRDNQILSSAAYNDIIALLPSQVAATNDARQFINDVRPPLPTRKSTSVVPPPNPRPQQQQQESIPKPAPRRLQAEETVIPKARIPSFNEKTPVPVPRREPVELPAYSICTVEAVYDFKGEDPSSDLSFKAGDVIQVTEYVNDDWWRGNLHGRSGIFPQNHVKKIE